MNDSISNLYNWVAWAGATVGIASAIGCLPKSQPLQTPRMGIVADRTSCLDQHIKSIWKGMDLASPECIGVNAYGRSAPEADRRIAKVCARTEIRTILTGEPPTSFTLATCRAEATPSDPPAIRRTCRAVSLAQGRDLNPVQLAACSGHLQEELSTRTPRYPAVGRAERPVQPQRASLLAPNLGSGQRLTLSGSASRQ